VNIQATNCELIAISQGWVVRDEGPYEDDPDSWIQPFEEMSRVRNIENLMKYGFYAVLWIEWIDGVAHRKAVGRVWDEAWKRQNIEVIKVVLE
jgi:hypothetical protein